MNYLLDTCVLSEFTRRVPDPNVIQWVTEADETALYISAISLGEIMRGIERMPGTHRKTELKTWFNQFLIQRFQDRVLSIDAQTMLIWGTLTARLEAAGSPLPAFDSIIASTALRYGLIVVTRNEPNFKDTGTVIINPWKSSHHL